MLLPAAYEVTRLIFENKHRLFRHCGSQASFWTIKGKQLALRRCIICCRAHPMLLNQVMSPLPTDRVQITRPFNISGDDYCGPFNEHYKIRGKKPKKVYFAIFCYFAIKAVHLFIYLFANSWYFNWPFDYF